MALTEMSRRFQESGIRFDMLMCDVECAECGTTVEALDVCGGRPVGDLSYIRENVCVPCVRKMLTDAE